MPRSKEQQQEVDRATASARLQLDFILANEKHLLRVRGGEKKLAAARDFEAMVNRGEELTPNMFSFVDGIYESTMRGYGLESAGLHVDKKRRTALRYGGA